MKDSGIVSVVRAETAEQAIRIIEAARKGGINVIEIMITVPEAVDVVDGLTNEYEDVPEIIFGGGSVLDGKTARS